MKIQLSLTALMFFAPLANHMMNTTDMWLHTAEIDFVKGYIKLGWINIVLFGLVCLLGMGNYFFDFQAIQIFYTISMFLLIFFLIGWAICIFSNIRIIAWKNSIITLEKTWVQDTKKDILLSYLPLENIFLWYQTHSFDAPNLIIKESLFVWTIFLLALMTSNIPLISGVFFLALTRIITLLSGVDIFGNKMKHFFDSIFYKNPEEIWGYARGLFAFLWYSKKRPFKECVYKQKQIFSYLYALEKYPVIIVQYIVWWIITWLASWYCITLWAFVPIIWFWALLLRYLVMIIKWRHAPQLPIAKELTDILLWMYNIIIWLINRLGFELPLFTSPTTITHA